MTESLALALHDIGALKFGQFTLKSGLVSPFYIDMRLLVSYPVALEEAADALFQLTQNIRYDRLAAIPYAALPIGVALSLRARKPLVYVRKERKEYGTGRQIEGEFNAGESALLIDDLVTRGDSKLEAIAPLRTAGLNITDIAVLLDRESGGADMLRVRGYNVHSLLTMSGMVATLVKAGRISADQARVVTDWMAKNP
jgi:uridine monophosphate synthetase